MTKVEKKNMDLYILNGLASKGKIIMVWGPQSNDAILQTHRLKNHFSAQISEPLILKTEAEFGTACHFIHVLRHIWLSFTKC